MSEHFGTIVIGGGQAGLAIGYHLRQHGLPFVILDGNERIGDAWRNRWDALRLFTPARYNGLPGMPFPGSHSAYPTKDETADYLEAYAQQFELPVRNGIKVDRLSDIDGHFQVACGDNLLVAKNVVVATGGYHHPRVPSFSSELDHAIVQLRSTEYRNRHQLQEGGVLVVGAGNSGAEIALDIAEYHPVWLSGPDTGQEPTRAGSLPDRLLTPILWLGATKLTVSTSMGRKLRDRFLDPPRGIPLGRVRRQDIVSAGIERVPRTMGVSKGYPVLEDGRVLEVSNVIWCTGFTPNYDWIDLTIPTRNGVPLHNRGVVESCTGLYFVGLLFLYSLSSALLGGVGRDAEHIVDHIVSTNHGRKEETHDGQRTRGESPLLSARRAKANERKRRTYAQEAPTYDEEMDFFEKWIIGDEHRGWACSRAKGITLEVAIGTGLNLPHYPRDLNLTGIDLSPEMLALARTRAQQIGRGVELLEADAQDLPFPDNLFDTVVCTYALCSVPDDAFAVSEMTRVLRPGGRLILVDHVRSTVPPLYWLQWLYEFIPRRTKGEYMTRRPAQHVRAKEFEIVAHGRLRAGIVERVVAVKRDPSTRPFV